MQFFADLLVLVGAGFFALAGVGMIRFADFFARIHAVTKAVTLGIVGVVGGVAVDVGSLVGAKLFLVVGLVFLTAPLGVQLLGRAIDSELDSELEGDPPVD